MPAGWPDQVNRQHLQQTSMQAVQVAEHTTTQNSPFLPQRRPKPSPVLITLTHGGMTTLSESEWPGKYRNGNGNTHTAHGQLVTVIPLYMRPINVFSLMSSPAN